jgi:hypothetical protein
VASRKKPMGEMERKILKSLEKSIQNDRLRKDTDKFINLFKDMQKSRKQAGGKVMAGKTSKYRAKGGMVKRMAGGKTSKYRAKGGTVSKMGGGMIGFKKTSKYKAKGGIIKKMAGGKASKYRAKGGKVK